MLRTQTCYWKNNIEALIHLYIAEPVYSWTLKKDQPHMTSDLIFAIFLNFHMEDRLRENFSLL